MRSARRGTKGEGGLGLRRLSRLSLLLILLAGTALGWPAHLPAQDAALRNRPPMTEEARRAIGQLRSPYCPGLMLEVCPSEPAVLLRDSIRQMALDGHDSDEIVEWMLTNHGEQWRAVPRWAGWGMWAWILPPAVLIIGAGVLIGVLRSLRARRDPEEADDDGADVSDDDNDRLAAALAAWDAEERER